MEEQPQTSGQSAGNRPPIGKKLNRAPIIRRIATSYPELTAGAIARRVGVSQQYASRVLAKFLATTEEDLRDYQENKADIYDATAQRILESITPEKLAKIAVPGAVISVGILHDKAALIRGQATSNVNVRVLLEVADQLRSAGE